MPLFATFFAFGTGLGAQHRLVDGRNLKQVRLLKLRFMRSFYVDTTHIAQLLVSPQDATHEPSAEMENPNAPDELPRG